jgi:hypothetical protein
MFDAPLHTGSMLADAHRLHPQEHAEHVEETSMTSNPNKDHEDLREPENLAEKDREKAARNNPDQAEEGSSAKGENPLSRLHFGSAGSGGAELEPISKPKRP